MLRGQPESKANEPRITADEGKLVISQLDQAGAGNETNHQRRMRVPYTSRKVQVELDEGLGRKIAIVVQGRNLSGRGISVIHSQFVHTGKRCVVSLPTVDGGAVMSVPGVVRRCRLVRGRAHEIAIAFDRSIDITEFVQLDGSQRRAYLAESLQDSNQTPAENGAPADQNAGAVVMIIEDFESMRDLYGMWLKKAGMLPQTAATADDAVKVMSTRRVDVIIFGLNASDMDASFAAVKKLRKASSKAAIICIGGDGANALRDTAVSAGCDEILQKPFEREDMLLAIRAVLSNDPYNPANRQPIKSSMPADPDILPVLQKFADQARSLADMLKATFEAAQHAETLKIVRKLAESGKSFGFAPVSDVSREAMMVLQHDKDNKTRLRREIDRVIGVLNRIEV